MFGALDTSTSALVAQRIRLDTIQGNIANMHATERSDGQPGPYRRRVALFSTGDGRGGAGVHVSEIQEDPSPPKMIYEPNHPHAVKAGQWKGYVAYPNVDPSTEMVNGMLAARAYEANVAAIDVTKDMISATMRILA
jgi:flagellar basal-body rod protein FlgC